MNKNICFQKQQFKKFYYSEVLKGVHPCFLLLVLGFMFYTVSLICLKFILEYEKWTHFHLFRNSVLTPFNISYKGHAQSWYVVVILNVSPFSIYGKLPILILLIPCYSIKFPFLSDFISTDSFVRFITVCIIYTEMQFAPPFCCSLFQRLSLAYLWWNIRTEMLGTLFLTSST